MNNTKQSSITGRVKFGFGALISILLLFGILSVYSIHRVSDLNRTIYNHPLVVSNAALQANVSITKMHRSMKDVVLFHSASRIHQSIETVNAEEKIVYQHLNIVKNKILGEKGKALERETRALFDKWRPIRNEVIELVLTNQRENAALITIEKGASYVGVLEEKMLGLTHYARNKASVFAAEAETLHSRLYLFAFFFLFLGTLTSFLVAAAMLKWTSQTETILQDSEKKYRQIFDTNKAIKLIIDPENGSIIDVNNAACSYYGYSKKEITALKISDINTFSPEKIHSEMENAKSEKRLYFNFRHRLASGEVRDVEVYSGPVILDKRSLLYSIILDITDRKKTEEALVQSETLQRSLMNTIPDLIWLKDQAGVYLSCNRIFERFFGAKESVIIGKTDYDFVDKDLADFFRKHDRKAMDSETLSVNEESLTFAEDGYHGLFETIKAPMRDAGGNLIGVLGIARDISGRKKIEDELKENEQRYKKAQRMGRVGNWEYDLLTEKFWASDEGKRIYGFDPESKNFTVDEVESCIIERERVHQALIDLIEQNKPYNLEFEIRPVSGPVSRTIRSIAEIHCDESGAPQKITGVVQDVTRQKQLEKEKILLERHLKQSQKMESIGNLAGGIAHDFNNILSSVIGFTELALDEVEKGSSVEDSLQEVYVAGKRARDLVKQILAFARQSDENLKPIQVDHIIKEVLQFIRSSIPATIKISQNIDSRSPIMGNPTQVYQIMMNLCTNAAHAMEEKGGTLEVCLKDIVIEDSKDKKLSDLKSGGYIEISVSDTGAGIPSDIFESIFEPYFTTKGIGEGTGMGLAMVHGIVETYNGKIIVESNSGKGTIFKIYLPVTGQRSEIRQYEIDVLPFGTEKILFVDDEAPIAKIGSQILEPLGYSVITRTSSVEALELFRSKPNDFDLVITDMTMPNMTGDELTAELINIRSDIPVILCTGYSKKISGESLAEMGIKAFAYKPVVKADLANTVRRVLDEAIGTTHN